MHRKEKSELQRLDKFNRWLVISYWRFLLVKQYYLRQSLPLRIVPLHALFMLGILFAFPHSFPPIITLPVIVVGAYYAALIFLFIQPSAYKSKIRKVESP